MYIYIYTYIYIYSSLCLSLYMYTYIHIYIYIWECPINCLLNLFRENKNTLEGTKIEEPMDASPARQAASSQGVNGSVRRLARWPANSPGGHSGNIAASQPADSSPAGWSASQQSRQPAGHQPEGRQAPIQSHNRRHPQSHFDDTIKQNARFRENPGRKQIGQTAKPRKGKNWRSSQQPQPVGPWQARHGS